MSIEDNDIEIARLLGIEAYQRGKACDSLLDNAEIRRMCEGYNPRVLKAIVGAFIDGWQLQFRLSR